MAAFAGQSIAATALAGWTPDTPPLAHPTHWIAGLLYLAPVLILGFAILWQRLNDRSRPGDSSSGAQPQAQPEVGAPVAGDDRPPAGG